MVYLRFEGVIRDAPDIYLRFEGLIAKYKRYGNRMIPARIRSEYSAYRFWQPLETQIDVPRLQNHPLETQIGDVAAKAGRGGCLRLATGQLFLGAVVLSRTTRRVGRIR